MGCWQSSSGDSQGRRDRNGEASAKPLAEGEATPEDAEEFAQEERKRKEQQARSRRQGVAAESVSGDDIKHYKKPVHPKDERQKQAILKVLQENDKMKVLFGHLDSEKLGDVVNAFYSKELAEGADVIKQGQQGDCLYIILHGTVDVFVSRPGADGGGGNGDRGPKVASLGSGALFGELALMYNAPRAATVTAASKVSAMVLGAVDFKMLLAQSSQAQLTKYEGWLSEVELLKTLNHYELSRLADILESELLDNGENIIQQGETGDKFYILEEGTAAAFIKGPDGEKQVKTYEKKGDYFGEIALLTSEPRQATVRAIGEGCSVATLSKENFTNILGPISDILKNHVDKYPQYADFLNK